MGNVYKEYINKFSIFSIILIGSYVINFNFYGYFFDGYRFFKDIRIIS